MPRKTIPLSLIAACFFINACESVFARDSKTYTQPSVVNAAPDRTKLMIIHEDAPVTDAMLSWREKANNFISFTNGEKEKAEAMKKIKSYPHAAEIAEKETAPVVTTALDLDKEPLILTFKGKNKTFEISKVRAQNTDVAYLLDYNIDEWALKPNPGNKSRFWVDIDMRMKITDLEKGTVLVEQKCYFADEKNAFSQYELFIEDAKLLKRQIRLKAHQCAKQINKTLGSTLAPQT